MSVQTAENSIKLDELLGGLTSAFLQAAQQLELAQAQSELPVRYRMPGMTIEVELTLSYQSGEIRGVFRKTQSGSDTSTRTTVKVDVVAIPRDA